MNRYIIAVSGNVGSGKTTLLKALFEQDPSNSILITEPLDEWGPALNTFKASGSKQDQLALQRIVSNFAKTTWETIIANPTKNILIERTTREHIDIFLDCDRLGEKDYKELVNFYERWNYDRFLTKVIKLDVPAKECYERIQKRKQSGDAGTSLEYLEALEKKYKVHFEKCNPRINSIVFSGNIGSGKTTSIQKINDHLLKHNVKTVVFYERLDIWGAHLEKFRETKSPDDLVTLQYEIAKCAKYVYNALKNPEKDTFYLIERSVKENISVFVDPHLKSGFITKKQYDSIVEIWNRWNYDELVSAIGYLDVEPSVCYERIIKRDQEGDAGITLEYLETLNDIYMTFFNDRVYHSCNHGISFLEQIENLQVIAPSKVIVFTGNIGSGKSTSIKRLSDKLGPVSKAILEPVDEWGDDLAAFKETGKVEDLLRLQKNIASFSKRVYEELTTGYKDHVEYYLIERSNYEHIKIFCEPLIETGFLTEDQYNYIISDYINYNFDKLITDVIFLDVPHDECYRRVSKRGQPGDSSVDPNYLLSLGKRYAVLYEGKNTVNNFLGEFTRVDI